MPLREGKGTATRVQIDAYALGLGARLEAWVKGSTTCFPQLPKHARYTCLVWFLSCKIGFGSVILLLICQSSCACGRFDPNLQALCPARQLWLALSLGAMECFDWPTAIVESMNPWPIGGCGQNALPFFAAKCTLLSCRFVRHHCFSFQLP